MSTTADTIIDSGWVRLGAVPPSSLTDARLQLHQAAQITVSATISYLPPQSDDSHTALTWSPALTALVTEPIAAAPALRFGLRPADLTVLSIVPDDAVSASLALSGRTVTEAHQWVAEMASAVGLDGHRLTSKKHYTIPWHPVADGAAFSVVPAGELAELERYWSNASIVLGAIERRTAGASPVRVWPHHFDIATLIALPARGTDATRRTIGVGHSPGDEWYAEPYWYAGPYPNPEASDLPPLDGGHWHTLGWIGPVLPASGYVDGDAAHQRRRVTAFIESAVAACRSLLS